MLLSCASQAYEPNIEGAEAQSYQTLHNPRQGGYKPALFVLVLTLLDNIGFVAILVSLFLYCLTVIHFDLSGSANTTTNFLGTAYLLTLVGALISDSYINRLNTCLLFGGIELLVLVVAAKNRKLQLPQNSGELYELRSSPEHASHGERIRHSKQFSEAPKDMKSLSTSFAFLSLSIGYYLSTVFVEIINSVTGKYTSSKRGWLEGLDLNKNHLELFYWFLAILSILNFGNYLFWANWYKYKKDASVEVIDQPMLTGSPINLTSPSGWSPLILPTKQGEGTD
ncbi:hypothetical protein AG4045_014392 [Apium graveolens]|uniref:Uncharacterized protein n=1 Tax=Apium graveolens TaxID=4045 RepID=A0A6L5B797_APIGR|nr:hypothetical protein AG4045_014392 [Apium graveolens]